MAPNVRYGLHLALLDEFLCLLLFLLLLLLQFEAFSCGFELLLVHYEEVAGAALAEVRLRQNVLNARDWRDFTFVIYVL